MRIMQNVRSSVLRIEVKISISSHLRLPAPTYILVALLLPFLLPVASTALGGSATWTLDPTSGDWNTAINWTPATVPNGPSDTATFQPSNITNVSLSADTEVDSIIFDPGASAYTITAEPPIQLTISGAGIMNSSGTAQNFVTDVGNGSVNFGVITFTNSASAGSDTLFINRSGPAGPAQTDFFDDSTAGSGAFINEGGAHSGDVIGLTYFAGDSTAGNATITNNGGVSGAANGDTIFDDSASAGNATIINNAGARGVITLPNLEFRSSSSADNGTFVNNGGTVSGAFGCQIQLSSNASAAQGTFTNNGGMAGGAQGGQTIFFSASTAASATLIANGGTNGGGGGAILFFGGSEGGMSRIELFGNGNLDISYNPPRMTIGSLEGNGNVFLGASNLAVGGNNLSTIFSGVIQDGGGTGGSVAKVGSGTLVLTNANTYTGGTTISNGTLLVNYNGGSGTGAGTVQVNAGTLGGIGTIAGEVIVGNGTGARAVLAPGRSEGKAGTLTIQGALTFNSDATFNCELKTKRVIADKVVANGVTIRDAQFSFVDCGNSTLTTGTVFTMIDNTAATAIAGTFNNLADGSTFTAGSNTFQANYEGGDGNDLTLTVVTND